MIYSQVRSALGLTAFLSVTAVLLVLYLGLRPFGRSAGRLATYPFFRACLILTGLRVSVTGGPPSPIATLLASNHVSYLDIPVLATLVDGRFVAKSEVRGWPLFGFLARISGTLFVSRKVSNVPRERQQIAESLGRGEAVFLFPEGSSSDGTRVMPFRPGLLSAVTLPEGNSPWVQPVSLVYGPAMSLGQRNEIAWYGDMDLLPHLWRRFGSSEIVDVWVHFHAPRRASAFADHRAIAGWSQRLVARGVTGGQVPVPEVAPQPIPATA